MPSNLATDGLYVLGFATVPFRDRITKRVCGDQILKSQSKYVGIKILNPN